MNYTLLSNSFLSYQQTEAVINAGALKFMQKQINLHAVSCLNNIASSKPGQTMVIFNAGAVPKLVDLLKSKSLEIAQQSAWALGNIAKYESRTRDEVLSHCAAEVLLDILQKEQPVIVDTAIFALFYLNFF